MSRIYLSPPHMNPRSRELLLEAFDSNWVAPVGPHLEAFEREVAERVGVPHAVAVASGTAAIHLALRILGVGAGDEVVVPTLTFVATANPVLYQCATPVFIDSSAATWNLDPGLLEEELAACARRGKLPKAVIAVDLYGQCADLDPIARACERYGVALVEDSAEALGATYGSRRAGSFGAFGVFSFNGNKIITTSGGGMLVTARREWADLARKLSTQAREDAPHYQHELAGYNYRLSNLLAAIGRGQLACLDERIAARRANREAYRAAFARVPGLALMPEAPYGKSNAWLTCITVDPERFGASREQILKHLASLDIEARPVWKPMHLQPLFAGARVRGGDVAAGLFDTGLSLPSGSGLTRSEHERITHAVLSLRR